MNYLICQTDQATFTDLQGCARVIGTATRFAIAIKDYNELPDYILECLIV